MFIRKLSKTADDRIIFHPTGAYGTLFSEKDDPVLWDSNLKVIIAFDTFLNKYRINYCRGLILQGELVTHPGHGGWDVAGEITAISGVLLFSKEDRLDVLKMRKDISEGKLYAVCTSAIAVAKVLPTAIPKADVPKRKTLMPAVTGANPVSFSRAWLKQKRRP